MTIQYLPGPRHLDQYDLYGICFVITTIRLGCDCGDDESAVLSLYLERDRVNSDWMGRESDADRRPSRMVS